MINFFLLRKSELESKLNIVYSKIKSGNCEGCASCCSESVGASYVEASNVFVYLIENNLLTKQLLEKIMKFYLESYEIRNKCPFLNENRQCIIYSVRPLNCRLYGHWTESDYNKNLEKLKLVNEDIKIEMKKHFYTIPQEFIDFQIPYCNKFIGEKFNIIKRNKLYDEIINIDSDFIITTKLNIEYVDRGIVEHIARFMFKIDKIDEKRIKNELTDVLRYRFIQYSKAINLNKVKPY